MYRVLVIAGASLVLASCASSSSNWFNLDSLKPAPATDTVQLESEPPGAEAKAANGQSCKTPCSLTLPADAPSSVTFTLNGYLPESEQLELVDGRLRPNPVLVELTAAPPAPKKPAPRKPSAKPAAKPKPAAAAPAAAPAPAAARPAAPAAGASPWPAPQR